MESRTERLRSEPVGKLLWTFSLPAIAGQLVISLYTVIDRAFLGNAVGADALAGVSLAMPIAFVIMAVGMLIGVGSGALVSIRLGQQRVADAEVILGNAFTLIVIASTALTSVALIFLEPLLRAFGATEQVLPYALQFMRIILFASFFQYSSFGLSAVIRSEGNPRLAMATMMINAGLNVVLDVVFIFGFGWGVPGAATATVISQGVAAIWVLTHFRSRRSVLKLRLANLRLRADVVRQMLAIGLAPFATQLVASLISLLILRGAARHGGETAVGAYGIIHAVSMLLMMPVLGIVQGAQPVIGFNWGARQNARVRRALKLAIVSATGVMVTGFLIVQLFPAQLIGLFVKDSALVAIGSRGMRLSLMMMPIIGFQIVGSQFFQDSAQEGRIQPG
jgi:putative MATE family efflux protein